MGILMKFGLPCYKVKDKLRRRKWEGLIFVTDDNICGRSSYPSFKKKSYLTQSNNKCAPAGLGLFALNVVIKLLFECLSVF